MDGAKRIVSPIAITFIDGTHALLVTDSASEIFLHPLFLKFIFICVALSGLMDRTPWGSTAFTAPELFLIWAIIAAAMLVWYAAALFVILFLVRRRIIQSVYTPVFIQPSLAVTHVSFYIFVVVVHGQTPTWGDLAVPIVNSIFVMALFELAFANFVAPLHPAFVVDRSGIAPTRKPAPRLAEAEIAPPSAPNDPKGDAAETLRIDTGQTVPSTPPLPETAEDCENDLQIGSETLTMKAIRLVRADDHYLHVTMHNRQLMIRGKLFRLISQIDEDLGLQINRSVWVAFDYIADIRKLAPTKLELVTETGESFLVSKYRRVAFHAAYERWLRDSNKQEMTGSEPG
ncbi:LytTR family DNA-binding domain-containing protein [Frigidibacter sp.]|uniref:LytTR family DNA-binding domain-containing protein n=1 Tax=Frigidibacter sp. TaxID=2586418 RepID=UPI002735FA0D|nr:LytTR family DNA-binding domain-containing protein [Frigidibacter sp.]MDP3340207.1 LytTR family DNA-binding domain-containing protein [Frigidibacter sp.]